MANIVIIQLGHLLDNQLAQSILKIVSVLAERLRQGEVGGCYSLGDRA